MAFGKQQKAKFSEIKFDYMYRSDLDNLYFLLSLSATTVVSPHITHGLRVDSSGLLIIKQLIDTIETLGSFLFHHL